jgi:hypothetical protein
VNNKNILGATDAGKSSIEYSNVLGGYIVTIEIFLESFSTISCNNSQRHMSATSVAER